MPAIPFRARPLENSRSRVERAREARKGVRSGRAVKGRCIGLTQNPASRRIHFPGSMLTQLSQGQDLSDGIRRENLRYQKVVGRGRRNILFLIDTSGSMLSDDRFAMVKGCVISLLEGSYAKRIRIAVISFGGGRARLELPFTSSAELAAKRVKGLRGGGSTPLVPALVLAGNLLDRMRDENLSVYLLSDGRYNRNSTGREGRQIREFGDYCRARGVPITLIDAGPGTRTARERIVLFAAQLHAKHLRLADLGTALFDSAPEPRDAAPG